MSRCSGRLEECGARNQDEYIDGNCPSCDGVVMLGLLQEQVAKWQRTQLDHATPETKIHKLTEEYSELVLAIHHKEGSQRIGEEIADCIIVLVGLADLTGVCAVDAVQKKWLEVQKRYEKDSG